jgi:nicotinate-nucleotide adenylyltransferase
LAGVIEKEMFWYFCVLVRFIDVIGLFSKQAAYWMYGLSRIKFRVFLRAGPRGFLYKIILGFNIVQRRKFLKKIFIFFVITHNYPVKFFMSKRKTALFGGTFDPIHIGHTTVAASAAEIIGAEKVIFVPAKRSPLKEVQPVASDEDRLEMIRLAITDKARFEVSDHELRKAGESFTIETVRFFKETIGGGVEIYWLMGADNVDDLANWYKIAELIDECNPAVMCRAGFERPDFSRFTKSLGERRVAKLQKNIIATPLIDISSTEIRKLIAAGEDVSNMVSPAVAEYIKKHGLYR